MMFSLERLLEVVEAWGLRVLMALVIFLVGKWLARWASMIVRRALKRAHVEETLVSFAGNLVVAVIMVFVVVASLNQLGVQTTSVIAVLGAAGLAVALSLQGSLSNFAAGVMMILFKPFKVGNFVEAGGVMGVVEEIGIFTTQMRSPDNRGIILPNGAIMGGKIINFSAKPTRRIDLVVGVSYSDDLGKVKTLLEDIVAADERILKEPAATIGVLELGESSINFAVRPWVKSADFLSVTFDLNQTIKERFDAAGISIPFPQRDIHIYREPGAV